MQIIIGSSIIPLTPGISLPLVLTSPLFTTAEGKIPGSYIFNTSFPGSEVLRHEFQQAHRVQRHGRATAELPYVITSGSLRYQGTCVVTLAERDKYEIAFKVNNGDFAEKLYGKTLKDLDLGGDMDMANPYSIATSDILVSSQTSEDVFTIDVNVPGAILVDFTNSLSNSGKTFTAHQAMTCTQIISISALFEYGALRVSTFLNGVKIWTTLIDNSTTETSFSNVLTLQVNDVVTVTVLGECEASPGGGYSLIFTLDMGIVEYSNPNILNEAVTLNQYSSDFTVFPVHNKEFLANFPEDAFQLDNISIKTIYTNYFNVLNYWKDGEFPLLLSGIIEGENLYAANLLTPFVYLRTLLVNICTEAGYYISNNPFDGVFQNAVLFNAYAENTYSSDKASIIPGKTTLNLSDHVPAMAQTDFLKWVSVLTGFMPVIDNNTFTVTFIDIKNKHVVSATNPELPFPGQLLVNPRLTIDPEYKGIKLELKKAGEDKFLGNIKELNDKLVYKGALQSSLMLPISGNKVNDMYYITDLNEYFVYQYNPDTYTLTWSFFSKKFPLSYSEGTEPYLTVSTDLCPLLTSFIADETPGAPLNRFWTIPKTEQAGILEGFPDSLSAEYGIQVLYYKGMSLDSLGEPYPLGTCRYDDYSGDPLFFPDISASSIFEHRYKEFLRWLAYETKPVTFKVILTAGQLKQIKFGQIYSGNGFRFLVKEIRVNMLQTGLSLAEMDVYTC